jgi:hypothetical protein
MWIIIGVIHSHRYFSHITGLITKEYENLPSALSLDHFDVPAAVARA